MTKARRDDLIQMTDKTKWPNFEMVIYKCYVTMDECRQIYLWLYGQSRTEAAHRVAYGAERYFGSFDTSPIKQIQSAGEDK